MMIFFSHTTQIATIRFPLTVPSGLIFRSLPQLLVASLASHDELHSSVNRGIKAVSMADGIQISKKLVSTSGWLLSALFTLVHTVNTVSLLQLSHRSRSSSIITLPVMAMF